MQEVLQNTVEASKVAYRRSIVAAGVANPKDLPRRKRDLTSHAGKNASVAACEDPITLEI